MQEILSLPSIIMPGEETIRKAVSRINKKIPDVFRNVKEIRITSNGSGYGFVTNDPKSVGVIFLDFYRIKSGTHSEEELINALEQVIAHEAGHLDAKLEGGEYPAEERARGVMRLVNACNIYNLLAAAAKK